MGVDAKMLVKNKGKHLSEDEVRELAFRLSNAFHQSPFWIDWERKYDGHHCLEIVNKYEQDAPTIYPRNNEQFIKVNFSYRYYGEGYERGDFPVFKTTAEWLEFNIPQPMQIWYGGDSGGCEAVLFDAKERQRLFEHWAEVGHIPYEYSYQQTYSREKSAPSCGFCKQIMIECGGGQGKTSYRCAGCKYETEVNN